MTRIILILCITLQTISLFAQQTFNERYFKDGMYIFDDIVKITPNELLENHKTDLGLTENDELVRTIHEVLPNGTFRSKYELYHNNIPVQGSAINLLGDKGVLLRASGFWMKNLDLPNTNLITSTQAIQTAINFVGAELYIWEDSLLEATLKEESGDSNATNFPTTELIITKKRGDEFEHTIDNYTLCFKVKIDAIEPASSQTIFVNAYTNQVFTSESAFIEDYTATGSLWTAHNGQHNNAIKTRSCGTCFNYWLHDLDRKIYTTAYGADYWQKGAYNKDNNNNWDESATKTAASAHWSIEKAWDYFINRHGRWGSDYNGKRVHMNTYATNLTGGTNAAFDPNETSEDYLLVRPDNQAGHSAAMLDVLAHEYTHAMIRASSNLGILGDFEARSLNEGYADIFGMRIEGYTDGGNHDWTFAEHMGTYQRNFADPHQDFPNNSPARYAELGFWSNTSPHANGGVLRRWFHLLSNGGPFGGFNVGSLGIEKADDLAYITFNWYLWSNANFQDMGKQTNIASYDHWGYCSNEHKQTARSLRAVGLTQVPIPACGIIIIDGPDVVLEHLQTSGKVAIKNNSGELSDDVIFTTRLGEDDMGSGSYQWTIPSGWVVEIDGNRIKLIEVESYDSKEIKCTYAASNGLTYEDARIVHFSNYDEAPSGNKNNRPIALQSSKTYNDIIIYPNPTSNIINIILPKDVSNAKVEIYNLNGLKILEQQINETQSKINTNDVINGIYLLKIISANKVSTNRIQIIK